MIYMHPKFSNELGFWRRQPNTTEISLPRSLVASQQLTLPRSSEDERNEEIGVKTNRRPRASMENDYFFLAFVLLSLAEAGSRLTLLISNQVDAE